MEFIRFGFSERNMCCCRQRSQPYTSFQKEPEDTQHLKKENALWKYHTITQTLVKSERIPGTYDTMQVLQRTVPSLYSVTMSVPERIDCTAFKGILFLWKRGWDLSISL